MLRPIFTKAFPSGLRYPFSRGRSTRYGTGSQRLPDLEKSGHSNSGRPNTLAGSTNGGGGEGGVGVNKTPNIYMGGGKAHRTWFNTAVAGKGSEHHDDQGSEGSWEEMVPMGRIMVRHDLDSETKDSNGSVAALRPTT